MHTIIGNTFLKVLESRVREDFGGPLGRLGEVRASEGPGTVMTQSLARAHFPEFSARVSLEPHTLDP